MAALLLEPEPTLAAEEPHERTPEGHLELQAANRVASERAVFELVGQGFHRPSLSLGPVLDVRHQTTHGGFPLGPSLGRGNWI